MIEKVYEIIDDINNSDIKRRLDNVKDKINSDSNLKKLIKEFEEKKTMYEKYNLKEDFIDIKTKLIKDEVIGEYIKLQNEINILTIYINKKINNITKNTTCK